MSSPTPQNQRVAEMREAIRDGRISVTDTGDVLSVLDGAVDLRELLAAMDAERASEREQVRLLHDEMARLQVQLDLFAKPTVVSHATSALGFATQDRIGHPDRIGFGYVGLGVDSREEKDEYIADIERAMKRLRKGFPDDVKVVRAARGRRLLVRVFDLDNEPTEAFKAALIEARRVGI